MEKIKRLSLAKKVCILIVLVSLVIGGVFYLTREKDLSFELKNNKDLIVEYGQNIEFSFEDIIQTKQYSKEELKEVKKETKITDNIKNEEGKEYPAIGEYIIKCKYSGQTLQKKVLVKDTTKPVFNDINEVSIIINTKDYDYSSFIQATDLSKVEVTFDTKNVDITKVGDYKVIATAKDISGNCESKEITVHIKKANTSNSTVSSNVQGIVYSGKGKVICIDAGHQATGNSSKEPNGPGSSIMKAKVTTGATGCVTGTRESQINLDVAIKLQKILTSRGYTVVMCRTSQNVNISNAERATIANNTNAAAFVRIHCDSSDSSSPTGTMTMAPSTSNKYCGNIAIQSQSLAKAILKNTCATVGSKNRGVSITDTMTGLNWSQVPVTIIEMGFLSNPTEDRLLNDSSYQDKLALGIANGIGEFLGN
ncbi:MAG: N-acetylmuramoyl-L-alanine amidase [Faecalibacillus sp.]